jgi:hypothetical protein
VADYCIVIAQNEAQLISNIQKLESRLQKMVSINTSAQHVQKKIDFRRGRPTVSDH